MNFALTQGVNRNRRTFPRIPLTEAGLLEFTPGEARGEGQLSSRGHKRITIMVSSVACEGMRLSRPEPIDDLRPGMRINIRLYLDNQEIVLPGQVAWMVDANSGETNVGVSLWLEAALASSRQVWANWIVRKTEAQRVSQQLQGRGNSVVKVRASAMHRAATNS